MNDVVLQMELEDGKNTSASDLVQCIFKLEELQLNECAKDIFALWMSSNLLGNMIWFRYLFNIFYFPEIYGFEIFCTYNF